jgi:hypothetical protein
VLDAVDLDDELPPLPDQVEVVGTGAGAPNDLLGGRRQAAGPALPHHVELAERADPAYEIEDDGVNEGAPSITADAQELVADLLGGRQSLLHGHGEDESGLPVAPGPEGGADGRHLGFRAWDAPENPVVTGPTPGLPDVQPSSPAYPRSPRHRHPDPVDGIVLESAGDQRRCTVEHRPGPASKTAAHCRPSSLNGPL